MYTIFCILEDEYDPFSIDIDQTWTVHHLKNAIKEKRALDLAEVATNTLRLYHVNFEYNGDDEEGRIKQVNEGLQGSSDAKPLNAVLRLSKLEKGFPDEMVHILIRRPPSESIHSRACDVVTETHPPNNLRLITALSFQQRSHCQLLRRFCIFATIRSQAKRAR